MTIRRAKEKDMERINELLFEVAKLHAKGRPDIFRMGAKKYEDSELSRIISNDATPVFVAVDESDYVLGYLFGIYQETKGNKLLCDMKTFYIDDLCIDKKMRGMHIGTALYRYALDEARKSGCYNLTLNVWKLNEDALVFYEKMGLYPLKTLMEKIL